MPDKDSRSSQAEWHRKSVAVADGFAEGVAGGFEAPAPNGGESGVVEEGMAAGFGNADGGDFAGTADGEGKSDGALLTGAAGRRGIFGLGLADAGGLTYGLFFCSGAVGGGLAAGGLDFFCSELLASFFFDTFAGNLALSCLFPFVGFFGLTFFFHNGWVDLWLVRRAGFGLGRRGCLGFRLDNGLRGQLRLGSGFRDWFMEFDKAEIDEFGLLDQGFGQVNGDSSPLKGARKERRREEGDEGPDQGLATP